MIKIYDCNTFIVEATVATIINYDRNMFIAEDTGLYDEDDNKILSTKDESEPRLCILPKILLINSHKKYCDV